MKRLVCFIIFMSIHAHASYVPDPITPKRLEELKSILTFVNGACAQLNNLSDGNQINQPLMPELFRQFGLPNEPSQLVHAEKAVIKATLTSWYSKK